ncbi:basic salivary proline-rich protein 4-like [Penaeus monodon]|uniref:basic salivary proline-rich protein 4-like n=1 Tax=Penaeus monodon TaxID=6687 RepID=UPI0018A75614|nr:basic salivary proline-rich protein 4-like [Penaeus monodon]
MQLPEKVEEFAKSPKEARLQKPPHCSPSQMGPPQGGHSETGPPGEPLQALERQLKLLGPGRGANRGPPGLNLSLPAGCPAPAVTPDKFEILAPGRARTADPGMRGPTRYHCMPGLNRHSRGSPSWHTPGIRITDVRSLPPPGKCQGGTRHCRLMPLAPWGPGADSAEPSPYPPWCPAKSKPPGDVATFLGGDPLG